jgi:hypothetical protein
MALLIVAGTSLLVAVVLAVLLIRSRRERRAETRDAGQLAKSSETKKHWDRNEILQAIGLLISLAALVVSTVALAEDDASAPQADEPGEMEVDKSETTVETPGVRPLGRQDDTEGANEYLPENVLDGNRRTAWVEGAAGLGLGTRLVFGLPARVTLTRVRIVNGYAKNTTVHSDNAAARRILISTDERREPVSHVLERSPRKQTIRAAFGLTRRVTIKVVSAYRGDAHERFQDLALSEVWFFYRPS